MKPEDEPVDGPGRWIPYSMPVQCRRCGVIDQLPFPTMKMSARCQLYGDEASRIEEGGPKNVFTYSLVGLDTKLIHIADDAVRRLKTNLEPSRDPDQWHFHMKDLHAGDNRKKHAIFAAWNRTKIDEAVNGLFNIIRTTYGIFVFNIAIVFEDISTTAHPNKRTRKTDQLKKSERTKREAYLALVMNAIDDLTSKGAQPILIFDSEKTERR